MRAGFHALERAVADPDAALIARFGAEINDDLNLPRALAVAWETLRGALPEAVRRATLARFDAVLGLGLTAWQPEVQVAPAAIDALAHARDAARQAKDWVEADRLRGELAAAGWEMEDRQDGYVLKRRS
jgi:cysteinyl-tRNA synthetase